MDFPSFVPSSRNYNLGDYAVRTFRAQSGAESRILYGDSRFGTTLELQYQNIADKNAETFMVHYENMKGTFKTFPITAGVMGGWDGLAFPDGFPYKNQRNSDATYIDQEGIIRTSGPNETRITYDLNGNSTGLLLEGESTNLLYPSTISRPRWIGAGTSTLLPSIADPAGNYGEVALLSLSENIREFNALGNTVLTYSFFARVDPVNNPSNRVVVQAYANVTAGNIINLGVTGFNFFGPNIGTNIQPSFSNYTRTPYPNDWFRFSMVVTSPDFSNRSRFDFEAGGAGSTLTFPTVWGVQVEPGSTATSYIPTNGAPVTRAADKLATLGAWRYAEPPDITSVRPGISNARVRLISVV